MEKYKINSLREYYEHSHAILTAGSKRHAFSEIWCREASEAILELLDEVEELPEYEYAMQLTVQGKVQPIRSWTTKERAQEKLDFCGTGRTAKEDPIYGPWSAKIVKRRKAGKVEDV